MAKKKGNKPRQRIESCTDKQQDRGLYVVERTGESRHQRHVTVTAIDYYLHRRKIEQYQWEAANMLFSYAVLANMTPGVRSASMQPTSRDGQNHTADTIAGQMDARRKVMCALSKVRGRQRRSLVVRVCIEGEFISSSSRKKEDVELFDRFILGLENLAKFFMLT